MIYKYSITGELIDKFEDLASASKSVNGDGGNISRAIRGFTRGNKYKEFIWKRDNDSFYESSKNYDTFIKTQGLKKEDIDYVKIWQTGAGEIRYSIKTQDNTSENPDDFKENLLRSLKKYQKPVHKTRYGKQNRNCAIINLFDAHIDKLSLKSEAEEDSSLEENIESFENTFDELLTTCIKFNPELIIIPIGNDFFHTNGPSNTTVAGTPLVTMCQSEDSFIIGVDVYRRCIDKACQYSKVYCPVIKGNHDGDKDFYLGECLKIVYEKNKNIEIENSRHQRKYIEYGENLIGFCHGDKEVSKISQLPLIMAEEKKEMWARTTFREWFLGDKHHKSEYKFIRLKDFVGCTVRFLRGVGTSDKWHCDNGYIGVPKTAELFIYDKVKGPKANFMIHI